VVSFVDHLHEDIVLTGKGQSGDGQIEYLLTQCVKQRKKDGKYVPEDLK